MHLHLDLSELKAMLEQFERIVQVEYPRALEDLLLRKGLEALNIAIDLTPVDTGRLVAGWQLSDVQRDGDDLYIELINNVPYATAQEEGFTYSSGGEEFWYEGKHMAKIGIESTLESLQDENLQIFKEYLARVGWR